MVAAQWCSLAAMAFGWQIYPRRLSRGAVGRLRAACCRCHRATAPSGAAPAITRINITVTGCGERLTHRG